MRGRRYADERQEAAREPHPKIHAGQPPDFGQIQEMDIMENYK